jgi:hypothetical protein
VFVLSHTPTSLGRPGLSLFLEIGYEQQIMSVKNGLTPSTQEALKFHIPYPNRYKSNGAVYQQKWLFRARAIS